MLKRESKMPMSVPYMGIKLGHLGIKKNGIGTFKNPTIFTHVLPVTLVQCPLQLAGHAPQHGPPERHGSAAHVHANSVQCS